VIFWFFDCGANPACVIVIGGKGAKARDVEPNPRLEPTLPKEPPHTKEESHGYEKEKGKKEENEVIECASLVLGPRHPKLRILRGLRISPSG
jgi:hypothetical protein